MGASASKTRRLLWRIDERVTAVDVKAQQEVLAKLAGRDAARMAPLPTEEEINTKDQPLDSLLNKLGTAIQPALKSDLPPVVPKAHTGQRRPTKSRQDEDAGRLPSMVLIEILKAKNAAENERKDLDLTPIVTEFGVDKAVIEQWMQYNAHPVVLKVPDRGGETGYAAAPRWFLRLCSGAPSAIPDELNFPRALYSMDDKTRELAGWVFDSRNQTRNARRK